eukprot:scaffold11500_cov117-Isochrysis_galbana.AAC.9
MSAYMLCCGSSRRLQPTHSCITSRLEKQNFTRAWRATMAPRQLRPRPIEDDMTADKGSK